MGRAYNGSAELLGSGYSGCEVGACTGRLDATSGAGDKGLVLAETDVVCGSALAKRSIRKTCSGASW